MSHNFRTRGAAGVLAALVLVAAGCQMSSSPTAPGAGAQAISSSAAARHSNSSSARNRGLDAGMTLTVDMCHRTSGDVAFILISVDSHAVPAHVEHGDGLPGDPVPGQPGNVFGGDCEVSSAPVCPCWANLTEAQLVAILTAELGVQQADCATSAGDVYARGVNGNTTQIGAITADMSCALRTSATNVSMTSLPASVFGVCLAQARQVVPQLGACYD